MPATRRDFLTGLAAAGGAPRLAWAAAGGPAYLAAAREPSGDFALFGLDRTGGDVFRIALPGRGHAATLHPGAAEAVVFARRPGLFALVLDCARGTVCHRLSAPGGRHFYGHGAFLAGGDILATPENDIDSGAGVIGLWSRRRGYARVGEMGSGGIGPHEIRAMGDDLLVVANGGIRTHPDRGRAKLNLADMRPNLSYLSLSGDLLERLELSADLRRASIRHLAVGAGGQVAFAMQWQGDGAETVPLLGLHRRGNGPVLASAGQAEQRAMGGYAGSVAFSPDGQRVAITSPRGGRLHVFDAGGRFLRAERRQDICGLAPAPGGFLTTDGLGGVFHAAAEAAEAEPAGGLSLLARADRAWDNHLMPVTG